MDRPVKAHLEWLQARLQVLTATQMAGSKPQAERNALESEIRAVKMAIAHYKSALEIEQSLGQAIGENADAQKSGT